MQIKLGQALSIRPDLLNPAAMYELQKLCDKVSWRCLALRQAAAVDSVPYNCKLACWLSAAGLGEQASCLCYCRMQLLSSVPRMVHWWMPAGTQL